MSAARRTCAAVSATVLAGTLALAGDAIEIAPGADPETGKLEVERPGAEAWQANVEDEVLQTLQTDGAADFFIGLDARADLTGAAAITDWDRRGSYVVERLRATATESQREVRALLDQAGTNYQPYWIANAILVRDGTSWLAQRIAAEPAVARLHEVAEYEAPELSLSDVSTQADAVEWGIETIGADQVWADFGVQGEEMVVANVDTGVRYDHPDLVDRYRGSNGDGTFDHDYNWFDPSEVCGEPSTEPCDNQGHGTHTMGTMIGGDADGVAIGVAPAARWIAAKGCEAVGQIGCSVDALVASGQWTLAPTDADGENPRPDLRPHIVNNSWGANTGPVADPFYDQVVDAWNAAGMFAVFSNGNAGSAGCSTTGSPADSPGAYGVGAHDVENEIASFSSRGPAPDGQIRPSITAPGVAVRSSVPGGYSDANGTSMAAPHVAGAAALMWSAAPSLVGDVEGTRELLDQTAIDTEDLTCGGTPEKNNVFGEGRLDAHAALSAAPVGPTGTLTGVVTDADTGEPVADATVDAVSADYQRTTTTDADGAYTMSLVTGEYEVTGSAYGYAGTTATGVEVLEDETTSRGLDLEALPSVTVSGTVTDGSGHGWPLYAGITVHGYPHGTIYTDPATGRYQVELPASTTYTVDVHTEYHGYNRLNRQVVVGTDDPVVDFALTASIDECTAPGYRSAPVGLYEPFDAGNLPDGWTLQTDRGDGWEFDDPANRDNLTGGDGGFASIDSAHGGRLEDGWLISPAADLSQSAEPLLSLRTDLILSRGVAEIELSLDRGATWENLWQRATHLRGPHLEQLPIPDAAGEDGVRVRFHYRNDTPSNGFWQLDEVLVGHRDCEPVPGGLLLGQVRDDRTDAPVNGATVQHTERPEERASSVDTPDDADLDGGFFWLFTRTGSQTFTARHQIGQYAPATSTVDVPASGVARTDFGLSTGELELNASELDGEVELGDAGTATVTVTNLGTAPASFQLAERDGSFELLEEQRAMLDQRGAPLRRLPVTEHGVVPAEVADESAAAGAAADDLADDLAADLAAGVTAEPTEVDWVRRHDAPIDWTNTLGAVHDGKLHVIGGSSGVSQKNMIYDIAEDRWSLTGSSMSKRSNPAGGFIGDLLYVAGGSGPPGRGAMTTTLIYDPPADSWSSGADAPHAVAAAGYAVLDDQLYVVGGRLDNDPDTLASTAVMVYDPADDSWRQVADYPEPAFWQACGPIDGLLYCAGGQGPDGHLDRAYVYSPDTDTWRRIADLPLTVARGGYTAANGLLMVSGGVVGGHRSNQGFYYDPAAGTWAELPNALFPLERMASACGFYKVGGFLNPAVGNVPWVEQLPGFDDCDTSTGDQVSWLSADPPTATLEPGESTEVTVTVDAGEVDQPGDHIARLLVLEDTPFRNDPVRVTMRVTPPESWGKVAGTVTGLDRCDGSGGPLSGAVVHLDGEQVAVEVGTDGQGRYAYWFDSSTGGPGLGPFQRIEVSAGQDGWVGETDTVMVLPGRTRTADFELRRDEPCASVAPEEISVTVSHPQRKLEQLTLDNHGGAAGYDYRIAETGYALDPLSAAAPAGADAATVDPAAEAEWTDAAEIPLAVRNYAHTQCPGDPDSGYLFGGIDVALGEANRKSWRYDAVTDSWHELAAIPEPGVDPVATCEAGKIHVLGGDGTDRHYVYDIARDSWSEAAALPQALSEAAAGAWDGKVYLAGGAAEGGWFDTLDRVDVYDIATDSWSEAEPMPVAAKSPGYAQVGQYLYLVGGLDRNADEQILGAVQRLDLTTGAWSLGPPLAQPRAALGVAATDQAFYALGGLGETEFGQLPRTTVQRLAFDDWDGGGWVEQAALELPVSREDSSAGFCTEARSGGEIWSTGGAGGATRALFHPVAGERCPTITSDVSWLDVEGADSGTVPADSSERLTVRIDARKLTSGQTYAATLLVTTTDPGVPELRIPVTVEVR